MKEYIEVKEYDTEGKLIVKPFCKMCGSRMFCIIGDCCLQWLCPAECQENERKS